MAARPRFAEGQTASGKFYAGQKAAEDGIRLDDRQVLEVTLGGNRRCGHS